jgi:hypothetical protein
MIEAELSGRTLHSKTGEKWLNWITKRDETAQPSKVSKSWMCRP